MNQLLFIIDSLLFAMKPGETLTSQLLDPTEYLIVTQRQTYCGKIIFQDDIIIKFRTEDLKPVKILKWNIKQISILKQAVVA
jgi:hypothetical protein